MRSIGTRHAARGTTSARFALGAAALLGLLVTQVVGTVGASAGPQATSSVSIKKQIKKLKKRVSALEKQPIPTSLPPNGAAGGDLTGSYPSPTIANGALQATDLGPVATGSADVGSIAANSCANFAILSLPGADDGDLLLVVPTGAGAGTPTANFDTTGALILMGIPHGGEGHVKVCNVSGAPIDPPSQSFKAVLIQG